MSGLTTSRQPRFSHSDALTGVGFAIILGLSAIFYNAGLQPSAQPSTTWSDAPSVVRAD